MPDNPNDEQPVLVTEDGLKKLRAILRRQYKGAGGIDVRMSPDGSQVNITLAQRRRGGGDEGDFFGDAKVVDKTAINGLIRWKYTIELGHWNMSSDAENGGEWVKDSGDDVIYAFNEAESKNTFTGQDVIGTGNLVEQSDGTVNDGDCVLLPIPVDAYVTVKLRGVDTSGEDPVTYYTIIGMPSSAEVPA